MRGTELYPTILGTVSSIECCAGVAICGYSNLSSARQTCLLLTGNMNHSGDGVCSSWLWSDKVT